MIMPSDKEYKQTKKIILGIKKMKSEFIPLAQWIDETFDVKTINIIYDTFNDDRPRLQICFEFEKEKNKFLNNDISYFDKSKQEQIARKFKEIIEQQGLRKIKKSLLNFFRSNKNEEYFTENVYVIYGAFEPIAKVEATYKITNEQTEEFIKSFNNLDIWTISIGFIMPTFFFYTDKQVKEYDKLENKKIWAEKFYTFVKPFDEFNYFKQEEIQVYIDSKENFDNNYQSSWFYYYK